MDTARMLRDAAESENAVAARQWRAVPVDIRDRLDALVRTSGLLV